MSDHHYTGPERSDEQDVRADRLARGLVVALREEDRAKLRDWARALLALRESDASAVQKARQALTITHESQIASKVATVVARRGKELVWTDRSWAARIGLGTALVTATAASGQGAGIAALGSAVGVPLWVVLGAGGTFAGAIIDEVERALPEADPPEPSAEEPGTAGAELEHIPEADWEVIGPEEIDGARPDLALLPPAILEDDERSTGDGDDFSKFRAALTALLDKARDKYQAE